MNEPQHEEGFVEVVAADALERIEHAAIDMQISTAKRYPRNLSVVKKQMLDLATLDRETSESCFYVLKRKGGDGSVKIIEGPSARLAEIAANAFGNMHAVSRIIGNDGKMITAQAVAHDLEKNVRIGVEVKRRITGRDGRTYSEDMQVVTGNAAASIALRNALFKVIPMALIKPIYDAAKKCAVGDAKTLADRRVACLDAFDKLGVKKERVFASLQIKGIEDIGLAHLEVLIGMHTAIKDGDSTVDEMFPLAMSKPVHTMGDALAPKQEAPQPTAAPMPAATASAPTPAAEPKKRGRPAAQPVAAPAPAPAPAAQTQMPATPAEAASPDASDEPPFEEPAGAEAEAARMAEEEEVHNLVTQIGELAAQSKVTESQVVSFAKANRMMAGLSTNLSDMTVAKLKLLVSNWAFALANIAKFPAT